MNFSHFQVFFLLIKYEVWIHDYFCILFTWYNEYWQMVWVSFELQAHYRIISESLMQHGQMHLSRVVKYSKCWRTCKHRRRCTWTVLRCQNFINKRRNPARKQVYNDRGFRRSRLQLSLNYHTSFLLESQISR